MDTPSTIGFIIIVVLLVVTLVVRRSNEKKSLEAREKDRSLSSNTTTQKATEPLQEEVKQLTALDISVIQARVNNLKVAEQLQMNAQDKLRRNIKAFCQKKSTGLWWTPLEAFRKTLGTAADDFMFLSVEATSLSPREVQVFLNAFALLIRMSKVQLKNIENDDGSEIEPTDYFADGNYRIPYLYGTTEDNLPLQIKEGKINIFAFCKGTNNMLKTNRSSYRLLLLAPNQSKWGMIFCQIAEANRAHKSKWGQVVS